MRSISVMLVDDSPVFVKTATRFLGRDERLSIVGVAYGGQEGLALAEELRPQVVLVDLAMPDLSGLAVIPRLRAELPEVRIIALTFWDDLAYREAAFRAGVHAFVPKAAMGEELLPAIYRLAGLACKDGPGEPEPASSRRPRS